MILRLFIFVLAAAAAGGAAWLTTQSSAEVATASVAMPHVEIETVEVLVSAGDIAGGEVLSPEKLGWQAWPRQSVDDRFITRADRPEAVAELAGTFVNSGFAAGEPIRESRLMAANQNLMSNKIEPGKRAAAVKVSAESAAGGFILPGDRVDVIHTVTVPGADDRAARNESRIIIPNVRVLAIDQNASQTPEGNVLGKTATLELAPPDAEQIMSAEASGLLSLALRSVADHAERTAVREEPPGTVLVRRRGESSTVSIR